MLDVLATSHLFPQGIELTERGLTIEIFCALQCLEHTIRLPFFGIGIQNHPLPFS